MNDHISKEVCRGSRLLNGLLLVLLLFISAGCALIPETDPQASASHESTPTSSISSPSDMDLLATAQTLATQIGGVDPVATAAAFATAQARTAALNTASGEATIRVPNETLTPTERGAGPNNAVVPDSIPIPEGDKENFISSPNFVSFTSTYALKTLTEFYVTEMQKNEWTISEIGTFITESDAQLNYLKPDRKATISLQFNLISERVTVVITVQNR